jgi:signal transduction histidine kinase/ligand-binding sensor domain-containing protein/DNA-binding response OmpR family regulator
MSALLAAGLISIAIPPRLAAENVRFRHLGVEDGLSHTTVWDVHQDSRGFVWIATETSLQRYDGYELRSYRNDPDDPASLSGSEVLCIHEDRRGRLWLATRDRGVNRYDRRRDRFVRYPPWPGVEDLRIPHMIRGMADDAEGALWIGSFSGLVRLDPESGETKRYFPQDDDPESLGHLLVYAVLVDRQGDVWAGLHNGVDRLQSSPPTPQGALHPKSERLVHSRPAPAATDPYANAVLALHEDPEGRLWGATHDGALHLYDRRADSWSRSFQVGPGVNEVLTAPDGRLWASTYGRGLFRVDPATGETENFVHDPGDPESLASDRVFHLGFDRSGLLWAGTRDGVSIHDPRRSRFRLLRSLAGRNVTALLEDRSGTVWIALDDGELSLWDPATDAVEPFPFAAGPRMGAALALHESGSGEIRGGFELGLARIDRARGALVAEPGVEAGLAVRAIAEDLRGGLWLGTFGGGLMRYDAASGRTEALPVDPADPAALPSKRVYTLTVDRSGRIWAGFEEGLSRVETETGAITTWRHDPARPESLGHDGLADLYEDRAGRLWIATYGGGLDRYDAERDVFHHYREKDGLASNNAVGILEDDGGRLWVSTNEGLSRLDPETGTFRNYYADDGLASNVFLIGGRLRLRDGDLVFGGDDGLTAFSPARLEDDPVAPQVAITELLIEGNPVAPGAAGSPLGEAVSETRELTLSHRQASFSLEFAALSFSAPKKSRYAFRLEGYDAEWIETDAGHRRARYTHPDPGAYVFRVRASNQDGVWNDEGAALAVRILPPPWRTWWAYSLYALAAVAAAAGYHERQRQRLERERTINARLREVDRLKDEFMANTSHELRTPLYGITGLAESLRDGVHGALPTPARNDLAMIVDSGRRLTGLVNDILDYSRLRDRELDLSLKPLDVDTVVGLVLTLMRPLAQGKELKLTNAVAGDVPAVDADENRLQQILVNLVGNAIKFTERGEIAVGAEVDGDEVRIVVSDTGLGIAAEHLERIFEPFEQIDGAADRRFSGTGLGLAVTRHLVELHGGKLEVRSTPGEGSRFSFSLPLAPPAAAKGEGVGPPKPVLLPIAPGEASFSPPQFETAGGVPTVLVVDDEQVVLQVLANQLGQAGYRSLQAASGQEALELLEERRPDLVLLDIMMPRISGFEVCRKIRQRYSLDELPVIYLTARSRVEDLVQGFSTGANDFLSKPITREELLSRVRLHLELKRLYENLEELVEKRTDQLRTVTGLLPICASCKRIRDDEGYWNDLEVYLSAHSDAQLTHGLCHECARRIYPEIDLSEAPDR